MTFKPEWFWPFKLLFRLGEVGIVLGLSLSAVKRLVRSKKLGHVKEGKVTLVTRRQLRAYVKYLESQK